MVVGSRVVGLAVGWQRPEELSYHLLLGARSLPRLVWDVVWLCARIWEWKVGRSWV